MLVSRSMKYFLGINHDTTVTVNLDGLLRFRHRRDAAVRGRASSSRCVVAMLNFAGLVSAKRLLGWWRIAIFLMFFFAAVVTPRPRTRST